MTLPLVWTDQELVLWLRVRSPVMHDIPVVNLAKIRCWCLPGPFEVVRSSAPQDLVSVQVHHLSKGFSLTAQQLLDRVPYSIFSFFFGGLLGTIVSFSSNETPVLELIRIQSGTSNLCGRLGKKSLFEKDGMGWSRYRPQDQILEN